MGDDALVSSLRLFFNSQGICLCRSTGVVVNSHPHSVDVVVGR